ncbi:MAG: FixH family protein [Gammaproteobacteria bacterium]|nr:FixH family protein [Gammaproteobacteria bacterium]
MSIEVKEDIPWYKQWMVWMVITPPVTAVVAGIITINIAINSDDGLVVDDYYKQGLGINITLQRDQLARDLKLEAKIFFEPGKLKVRFSEAIKDPVLYLKFIHPTQSQRDKDFVLTRFSENAYQADISQQLSGNWNMLLEPEDKSWRIMGRADLNKQSYGQLSPNLK